MLLHKKASQERDNLPLRRTRSLWWLCLSLTTSLAALSRNSVSDRVRLNELVIMQLGVESAARQ
jgi:hypothetical protein